MKTYEILSPTDLERLVDALKGLREKVQWKHGKDTSHLDKRRRMRHLEPDAGLEEYEGIISEVANNGQNVVYLYKRREVDYYAIQGEAHGRLWLVIFGLKGLMETAFPPADLDDYLDRRGFVLLGRIDEVLR